MKENINSDYPKKECKHITVWGNCSHELYDERRPPCMQEVCPILKESIYRNGETNVNQQ